MKNIISKISVILGLVVVLASCEDELNRDQVFTETTAEQFFNSPESFVNGLNGIYSQFQNYYASAGSGLQGIPDILADNCVLVQTGRTSNELYYDYRYVANSGGALALYWSEAYEAINIANLVIENIDNLVDGPIKDNILAEALACRALAHFDLARIYAPIPTQSGDANNADGIVYFSFESGDTGDPFVQPARESVGDNYVEILADLTEAASKINADNGEGRFDRDAVNALLSRVYLYTGNWQAAIDAANLVTTPLAAAANLELVYQDATNEGVIMEFSVNTSSEAGESNVGVLYSQSSGSTTISEYAIEFDFWASIAPNDLRRNAIQFVGENQGNQYNAIKKFLGETGQVNGRLDAKVIRAAEVVLNKAEAQFNLGLESDALATLDQLRANRYTGFVSGGETGAALDAAIQFERRVELCFEGHRWFDLKRRGEAVQRGTAGDIIDGTGTPAEIQLLPAGDTRFQLPIPIAEINANPNMAQNPGY